MKNNQNGFIGIALLVIVAIGVSITGTLYYVKKNQPTQPDLTIETPISEPTHSSTSTVKYTPTPIPTTQQSPTEGPNVFKTHTSKAFKISFNIQKDLFVHENVRDGIIEVDKYEKPVNQGVETDATTYDVRIMVKDVPKGTESYTLQQHLVRLQKPYTSEEGIALRKYGLEPKVTIKNISGVNVIQVPDFADLAPYIRITYHLFHNGKEYWLSPSGYENKENVKTLDDIVMSLKFY